MNYARQAIVHQGIDPVMSSVLRDIANAKVKEIVAEMTDDDIRELAQYINIPLKRNNTVNVKAGRQLVEIFLMNYPAFRSQNSKTTIQSIIYFFQTHPNIPRRGPIIPAWARNLNSNQLEINIH